MQRRTLIQSAVAATCLPALQTEAGAAAGSATSPDAIAVQLQKGLIWLAEPRPVAVRKDAAAGTPSGHPPEGLLGPADPAIAQQPHDQHAAFVKPLMLDAEPREATLHLFAYTRYRLFVNGQAVGRGPARFQNERPEYDSWDLRPYLRAGLNTLAVLAHRDAPTGRIMAHAPGMTALLAYIDAQGQPRQLLSDESWRSTAERSFGPRPPAWSSVEERVDLRLMPDWTADGFDPAAQPEPWPLSVRVPVRVGQGGPAATAAATFHPFHPRSIPLLHARPVAWRQAPALPLRVAAGTTLTLELPQITLGTHRLAFEAEAGTTLELRYGLPQGARSGINRCTARAGAQVWEGGDSFAFRYLVLTVRGGSLLLTEATALELRYPFERLGRFECDDPALNRLWALCAHSLEIMSEDAYTDCADRERVEWTDNTPPAFDCTRVMMAGPPREPGGRPLYGDARLQQALLRRIALTQQPDGQIKAHSCSERWDIHAIMECRSCDWVISLRRYVEATDDTAFVQELWPTLQRLLAWFLRQRTPGGLVQAREWTVWDNPLRYQLCEGTTLNALVFQALNDAAWLGRLLPADSGAQADAHADAKAWAAEAQRLGQALNAQLWDEATGAYYGARFGPGSQLRTQLNNRMFDGPFLPGGYYRPTLQAALFALEAGVVPPERLARVNAYAQAQQAQATGVMTHHFLFKALYALDQPAADRQVLDLMRTAWKPMLDSPWGTSWEMLKDHGESKAHVYGMLPGWFLSAQVLGVQVQGAVREGRLRVEPRPGGLNRAAGVVVTEFGPVPLDWVVDARGALTLNVQVPPGCRAHVALPLNPPASATADPSAPAATDHLLLNGRETPAKRQGRRLVLDLGPGAHQVRHLAAAGA